MGEWQWGLLFRVQLEKKTTVHKHGYEKSNLINNKNGGHIKFV